MDTLFFLFLPKNIDYRYSLEPHRRSGSNEYPQSMFWAEIWKYQFFIWTIPVFGGEIFYISVFVCLYWDFTAQSIQWGHVERGQFT